MREKLNFFLPFFMMFLLKKNKLKRIYRISIIFQYILNFLISFFFFLFINDDIYISPFKNYYFGVIIFFDSTYWNLYPLTNLFYLLPRIIVRQVSLIVKAFRCPSGGRGRRARKAYC